MLTFLVSELVKIRATIVLSVQRAGTSFSHRTTNLVHTIAFFVRHS